jgi:hypothetical protein
LNCPACDKEVKVLPDKPEIVWNNQVTSTTLDFGVSGQDAFHVGTANTVPTSEVYKCCNETCWVTRIEVDWGRS